MGAHLSHHGEDDDDGGERGKEPMLLLDVTGSMDWGTSATDDTPRRDTVGEAISLLVTKLGEHDTEAEHEDDPDEGGLRTVTFAGGKAKDLGDLNKNNVKRKWASIEWKGGTFIMPGYTKLLKVYKEEFGKRPASKRPILMALVITDGEAADTDEFEVALKSIAGYVFVTVALVGFGEEHDRALAVYKRLEENNSHIKVVTFDSETDPKVIANKLLNMVTN